MASPGTRGKLVGVVLVEAEYITIISRRQDNQAERGLLSGARDG